MARKAILSGAELIGYVESSLEPYIGAAASIADHRPILNVILDLYFYGMTCRSDQSVVEIVTSYGIPSDIAKDIDKRLSDAIISQIQMGFGRVYPSRHYSYYLLGSGDIVVEESIGVDPEVLATPANDPSYRDVLDGIDNGDWIPERIRRSVGCL